MSIRREEHFCQQFNSLLPDRDPCRQEALRIEFDWLRQHGRVDLYRIYTALEVAAREAREQAKAHKTLTEARPLMKEHQRLLRKAKEWQEDYSNYEAGLNEPRKNAFRLFAPSETPYSSGPTDTVSKHATDLVSAMEKDPTTQIRRPEGHQPEPWRRDAHRHLRAAGVRSVETRKSLLRLIDPRPYPES